MGHACKKRTQAHHARNIERRDRIRPTAALRSAPYGPCRIRDCGEDPVITAHCLERAFVASRRRPRPTTSNAREAVVTHAKRSVAIRQAIALEAAEASSQLAFVNPLIKKAPDLVVNRENTIHHFIRHLSKFLLGWTSELSMNFDRH